MKYISPNIDNWPEDDRRRNALSWTLENLRQMHNVLAARWHPASDVKPIIGHPVHPFIQRAHGATLEVGCGDGLMLVTLLKYGTIDAGTGIDISDLMIEHARQSAANVNIKDVEFIRVALEDYEPEVLFDTVIAYHVLEHFWSVTKALEKMVRLLQPKGILLGVVPEGRCCDGYDDRIHLHYFNQDDLLELFKPYFRAVEVKRIIITENETLLYFVGEGLKGKPKVSPFKTLSFREI